MINTGTPMILSEWMGNKKVKKGQKIKEKREEEKQQKTIYRNSKIFNNIEKMDRSPASQEEQQHHKKSHAERKNHHSLSISFKHHKNCKCSSLSLVIVR